jgi:hypothetical protein
MAWYCRDSDATTYTRKAWKQFLNKIISARYRRHKFAVHIMTAGLRQQVFNIEGLNFMLRCWLRPWGRHNYVKRVAISAPSMHASNCFQIAL